MEIQILDRGHRNTAKIVNVKAKLNSLPQSSIIVNELDKKRANTTIFTEWYRVSEQENRAREQPRSGRNHFQNSAAGRRRSARARDAEINT